MRLTVEHLLYLLLVLLAALLRLFLLDAQPLHIDEATVAWSAWLNASGLSPVALLKPDSALYHTLQSLVFWPAVVNDGLARLTPALAGIGIVALPWWWRSWLGRGQALLLASFFAFDPWLVYFSRQADGAILTIFCALLLLTLLLLRSEDGLDEEDSPTYRRKLVLMPIVLGLFLVSGALVWSFLPLFVIFVVFFLREEFWQYATRRFVLILCATILLGATGWFTDFDGLAMLGTSVTRWLTHWQSNEVAGMTLSGWWLRLLADQPLTLLLGVAGLLVLWRQSGRSLDQLAEDEPLALTASPRWVWFVSIWLAWGLLLSLAPGRSPLAWPILGLGLLFCAIESVMALLRTRDPAMTWGDGNLLLTILAVLAVSTLLWGSHALFSGTLDLKLLQPVVVLAALALLLCGLYAFLLDGRQATFIVAAVVSGLLLLANVSATWHLNFRNTAATPDGFVSTATHPDAVRLAQDIQTISAQRAGDPGSLPVVVEETANGDPVLGWYLRAMHNLTWSPSALPATASEPAPLLLTRRTELGGTIFADYMGSHYRLYVDWQPGELKIDPAALEASASGTFLERLNARWSAGWRARLRWLMFRELNSPLPVEEIVLWAP